MKKNSIINVPIGAQLREEAEDEADPDPAAQMERRTLMTLMALSFAAIPTQSAGSGSVEDRALGNLA